MWTIRAVYKLDNGSTKPVKSTDGSDFKVMRSATFTRNVTKDATTGKVVSTGQWPGSMKLAGYEAPAIQGYTPDKSYIDGITVSYNSKPADTIIYYTQNPEDKKTAITETKEVSRKITYYRVNDDGSLTQTWGKTQRATFTRSGIMDGNGKKTYNAWTPHTWEAETVSPMDGYTPDMTTIAAITFTPDNPPKDINVYFRKNAEDVIDPSETKILDAMTWDVVFTDGNGKVLKTDYVKAGKAAVAPANPTREGYTFAGWDKDFSNVQSKLTVSAKWTKNATQQIAENKHIERKIYYYYSDGKKVIDTNGNHACTVQTADFTRYNTKDTVTGKITYGKWSAVTWNKENVMTIAGYTPSISYIDAVTFTPDNPPKDMKVYYTKGTVARTDTFTGVRKDGSVWKIYKNGKVNTGFTGFARATDGQWYYFRNGVFCSSYTGLTRAASGKWYYVRNGKYDTSYTGMTQAESGKWYYVKNGNYCTSFTGLAHAPGGKWMYVSNGVYNPRFTGLARAASGRWYYVKNGNYDKSYTGLARAASGKWYYVKNGNYDTSYTGKVTYNGKVYNVKKGQVI